MTMDLHRGYLPGCIGRVAELHATYYARTSGFGRPFEVKVASELAAFCERFDAHRDGLWLVVQNDRIEASIAIDGRLADTDGAHLRWFIASDAVRGTGVGHSLLSAALAFCDDRRYERCFLWTFDALHAARHLYEKHGFGLDRTLRGGQWGTVVNEQRFVRRRPG